MKKISKIFFSFLSLSFLLITFSNYIYSVTVTETSAADFGDGYSVQTDTLTVSGSVQLSTMASPSWYSNNWAYRKEITITNPNTQAIVNFQVWVPTGTSTGQVDLDTPVNAGKMQSDQGDVRFTDIDGTTLLNYWIQPSTITSTLGKTVGFWVKVSSIAKTGGTRKVYMYYGNSSTGTTSNFDNTMEKTSTSTAANVYDTRIKALYNLDDSQIESELLPDGVFEQWTSATNLTNWDENGVSAGVRQIDRVVNPRKRGSYAVKISAISSDGTSDVYLSTGIQVQNNRCYQINFWMEYSAHQSGQIHVGMWQDGAVISSTTIQNRLISMNTGYYTLRATATATGWAEIRIEMDNEINGVAYFDDMSVRYSTPSISDGSANINNGRFRFGAPQTFGVASFNSYDGGRCGDISSDTVKFSNGDSVSGMAALNCEIVVDDKDTSLDMTSAITLEAWGLMRSSVPPSDYNSLWIVRGNNANGGWGIYPENVSGADFKINGKIKVTGGGGTWEHISDTGDIPAIVNNWYHIVMTYDSTSGNLKMYVNGLLSKTRATVGGTISFTDGDALKIANSLSGMVDGVAIYNVVMSSMEVISHYYRHRYVEITPTCSIGTEQTKYYSGGSYASSILFTGINSTPMTLVWFSSTAATGGQLNIQVRASDTQFFEADGAPSWVNVNGSSDTMMAAVGKYMQYRSTFSTVYSTLTPVLNDVTIVYSSVTVPSAPTGLFVTNITSGSVTWNWTDPNASGDVDQEDGFRIFSSTGGSYVGSTAADITSWNEMNLSSNTLYTRYIQAYNSAGSNNSVNSSTCTLSAPPNNLTVSALYRSSATVNWNDVGATSYSLERAVGASSPGTWSVINSTPTVGYTYTGLLGETTYWFRVKSYNDSGVLTATASNIVSTVTVPLPPSGFTASQISTSSIMWSWTDNSNFENGYRVYASTDGIVKTLSANVTYWIESNKPANTQHSRYVAAFNATESNSSNVISSYTLTLTPTNLIVNVLYRSSATVSWDNVGAAQYSVERAVGVTSPGTWSIINSTPTVGYTYTGLSGETTYWFRVKSYNADGLINDTASNVVSTVTITAAPSGFTASQISTSSIMWSWTDNSGAETGYRVYASTDGIVKTLSANVTYWIESNKPANTQHSRYVVAFNANESDLSNVISSYTLAIPPTSLAVDVVYRTSATVSWDNIGASQYSVERAVGVTSPGTWSIINSTPTVGYTYTGLSGETTYWFRVKSYNADGLINDTASNVVSTVTITAAPSGFTASQISTSSIMWSWTDNSGAETGYRVYASTDGIVKTLSANVTYWIESNKPANTQHSRYVVSFNTNESDFSNVISSYTLAVTPANLTITAIYKSSTTMTWDNAGAAQYAIERSTGLNSPVNWQFIKQLADNITGVTYTDTDLIGENTYWYRIKSYNNDGLINNTGSNVANMMTASIAQPTNFVGTQITTSSIMWAWNDNSNIESGYYVRTSTGGTIKTLTAGGTYYPEVNLQPNTQFSRYVVTFNGADESDASNIISSYTLASVPTNLAITVLYKSSATLVWDNVSATRYAIERSTGLNSPVNWQFIKQWVDNINGITYTDTGLLGENTYWYRIKSYNNDALINTTASNIVSTITVAAAPTGFTASQISSSSVMWSWIDNSNVESGYYVITSTGGTIKTLSAGSTYWPETGLQQNTQYGRYAVAFNSSNESDASSTISTYTLTVQPTNLVATVIYGSSATISWDNVGATRYTIERSTGDSNPVNFQYIKQWVDNITSTNFTDSPLTGETTYWYRVNSYNAVGILCNTASNIISLMATSVAAPTGFTASQISSSSIMWAWSDVSNTESGYYIRTSTSGTIKTLLADNTYWSEIDLQPNTQYSRYAVTFNGLNESDASNTISTYTLSGVPSGLSAVNIYLSSVTVSWSGNGTRYAIERSINNISWAFIKQWADSIVISTYTDTGLTMNATYYYRVSAYNAAGIITGPSAVLTAKTLKRETPPDVPSSIVVVLPSGQSSVVPGDIVRLNANAEAGSIVYSITVKDQNGNILVQWIRPIGAIEETPIGLSNIDIADDGVVTANLLLGDIASKFPMVNGITIEIAVEDQFGNISQPGSTNLINISAGRSQITLYNNLFNPNTGVTTIRYDLVQSGNVKIEVYTLNGEKVITLVNENKDTGVYWLTWNGKDTDGDFVSSGVYFVHIKGPGALDETKKVCVIK